MESVLKDAMSLSPQERSMLAEQLWRSVPHGEAELALTARQAEDLRRRIDEDDAGSSDPQDWEQFRPSLRCDK